MLKFIREYKKLKYLAYHDSLTGLLNRNWLYQNLNTITQSYVYFIDINNLKEINKRGHTHGDEHIKEVIKEILALINYQDDILIRYAGDEFILFTNETGLHTCKPYSVGEAKIFDQIRSKPIKDAIIEADSNMIISKEEFKNKK